MRLRLDLAYDGTALRRLGRPAGPADRPGGAGGRPGAPCCGPTGRRGSRWPVGRTPACTRAGQVAHVDIPAGLLERSRGRSDATGRRGAAHAARRASCPPTSSCTRSRGAPDGLRRAVLRPAPPVHVPDLRRRRPARPAVPRARPVAPAARSTSTRWPPRRARCVGRHDFASYCKPRAGATTIRTLEAFALVPAGRRAGRRPRRRHRAGGRVLPLDGALARRREPGRGGGAPRRRAGRPSCSRPGVGARACTSSPAHGLTLEEVGYPPDDELAARAVQTRARRAAEDLQHATAAAADAAPARGLLRTLAPGE